MILSISHVRPFSCVGIIPTVLDEMAASTASGSIKLSSPISTGIGIPPANLIAEAVASIV